MASTTSFTATAGTSWAALVVGSAYASCQLQASSLPVAIAVGTSLPAASATDYFVLGSDAATIVLSVGDTIYARGLNGSATVRGIRVSGEIV
jgi:hypothetical protein